MLKMPWFGARRGDSSLLPGCPPRRVNHGITSYREEGGRPPKGFRLRLPGQPERVGTVSREITYLNQANPPTP